MLEAGVSSSLEIARFWGIADEASRRAQAPERRPPAGETETAAGSGGEIGHGVMAAVDGHVPAGVKDVIAAALRTAGLMR
jgi:hypothetical protein